MKLKTLLLVVAILCVSLFVVACGDDETTTADQGANTTTAATTKATTKKTTAERTTKATTTTVTTTLDPNYKNVLPAKLPDNSTYDIHTRIGLDAEADLMSFEGAKYANLEWPTSGGAYGGCIKFGCHQTVNNGGPNRAEGTVNLLDPFLPEGVKGIMFYVDASGLTPNGAGGVPEGHVAFSVTIGANTYRSNKNGNGTAKGYYYKDGAWVETTNANACRMVVPDKFKGFIYVPITEYWKSGKTDSAADLYDAATGLGLGNVFVEKMNLYTEGYDYAAAGAYVIFDEIVFVK